MCECMCVYYCLSSLSSFLLSSLPPYIYIHTCTPKQTTHSLRKRKEFVEFDERSGAFSDYGKSGASLIIRTLTYTHQGKGVEP